MKQARILVIEDSLTQAQHVQSLLEKSGLQVMLAEAGRVGLEMARQHLPDLILLDLQMPDMDGFEVCEVLKENQQTKRIPVIMLTRMDDSAAINRGLKMGVSEYIPKDAFADIVLLETLREMGLILSSEMR